MDGDDKLEYPEKGDDVRDGYIFIQELVNMQNRPWLVQPNGMAQFKGSKDKVALIFKTFRFIVEENGRPQYYDVPANFINTISPP